MLINQQIANIREGEKKRRMLLSQQFSEEKLQIMNQKQDQDIDYENLQNIILNQEQQSNRQLNLEQNSQQIIESDRQKLSPLVKKHNQDNNKASERSKSKKSEKSKSKKSKNSNQKNQSKNVTPLNDVWKNYALTILILVARFILLMKQYSQQYKFKQLTKDQFNLINDSTSYFDYYKKQQYFVHFKKFKIIGFFDNFMQFLTRKQVQKRSQIYIRAKSYLKLQFQKSIDPDSLLKYFWDFIILIFLMTNIYFVTLDNCFLQYYGTLSQLQSASADNLIINFFFKELPIFIIFLDICFNLNTAYYDKGILIKSKILIIKNYVKKRFILDILILFLYVLAYLQDQSNYRIILFFRIRQINQILNTFSEAVSLKDMNAAIYDLAKLVLFVLLVGHLCACAFFLLSRIEKSYYYNSSNINDDINHIDTWIDKISSQQSQKLTAFDAYVASYYWACITMITVGYGDIVPINTTERCFSVIMTFVACGVFAYTVNSVGSIINSLAQKNAQFKNKMSQLTDFMKKRGMKIELQMKVKKYFQYLHDDEAENGSNNNSLIQEMIMQNLTGQLINEVMIDIYGRILKSEKIFALNFSEPFLNQLALKMTEKKFGPEDIIFREKDIVDSVYFIQQGDITLYLNKFTSREDVNNSSDNMNNNNNNYYFKEPNMSNSQIENQYLIIKQKQQKQYQQIVVKNITKGDILGQVEFFTNTHTQFNAVTKNVVTAVTISKQSFLECIKEFPSDYEHFCLLKDNFNLYNYSKGMGVKCGSCEKFTTHNVTQCPFIQYQPIKQKIISKYNQIWNNQERKQFQRKDNRLQNTWMNIEIMKDSTIQFIINNYEQEDIKPLIQMIENINLTHSKNLNIEQQILSQQDSTKQLFSDLLVQHNNDSIQQLSLQQQNEISEKTGNIEANLINQQQEIQLNTNEIQLKPNSLQQSEEQVINQPLNPQKNNENLANNQRKSIIKRKTFIRTSQKRISIKQSLILEEINKIKQQSLNTINENLLNQSDSNNNNKLNLSQIYEEDYKEEDRKPNNNNIFILNNPKNKLNKDNIITTIDDQSEQKQQFQLQQQNQQESSLKNFSLQDIQNNSFNSNHIINNNSINNNNIDQQSSSSSNQILPRQNSFELQLQKNIKPPESVIAYVGSKKFIQDENQNSIAQVQSKKSIDPQSSYSENMQKSSNLDSAKLQKLAQNKQNGSQQENLSFSCQINFDTMKEWKIYYPHNNYTKIIDKLKVLMKHIPVNVSLKQQQFNELYSKFNRSRTQKRLEIKKSCKKSIDCNQQIKSSDKNGTENNINI